MLYRTHAFLIMVVLGCIVLAGDKPQAAQQSETAGADSASDAGTGGQSAEQGLHVQFSLNRPEGGRYRRPYVAVWLEDDESYPVKTGLLWLQTDNPGPRWHRDLTRWYRNDRLRKLAEKTDLIDGISGATRGPGDYKVHFDGKDNSGKPLKPGKYTLCLEVAREHGTYQIVKQEIEWGGEALEAFSIPGNVEFSNLTVSFVPAKVSGE